MTDEIIAFHNMILAMEGKEPPLFVVQLSGTEEEKDYVYEKEKEFVAQAGYDAKYMQNLTETPSFSGAIIFCKRAGKNTPVFPIDCSFAENELVPAWVKNFIIKTHFIDMTGKDLMNDPNFSDLKQAYANDPVGTVTKTILYHFKRTKDLAFLSSDLDWLKTETKSETESDQSNEITAKEETKQEAKTEPKVTERDEPKPEPKVEEKAPEKEEPSNSIPVQDSVIVQEGLEPKTPEPPKPDPVVPETPKEKVEKETLTPEEEEENKRLLANLVADYKNAIQTVRDTRNPGFRIIEKKLNECINKNEFNTQFCRIYMEISNDYSTALYAALYALDNKTKEFREKITHRVAHFGCPQCGNEWDEDLTFRPKGVCEIICPKCGQGRMFEV
jgi:hypothetical protein